MASSNPSHTTPIPTMGYVRTNNAKKRFGCLYCTRQFAAKVDLDQHCGAFHSRRWSKRSTMASSTVKHVVAPTKLDVSRQIQTASLKASGFVSRTKPFKCQLCEKSFAAEYDLAQHRADVHRLPMPLTEPNEFRCATCKAEFPLLERLEAHKRSKNHCFCLTCQLYFVDESATRAHQAAVKHVTHYHCFDCMQDFLSEHALAQHSRDKLHKKLECQLCQQVLGSLKALESHVVLLHGASANVKRVLYPQDYNACYICQRRFKNPSALGQHLNSQRHHPLSDLGCIASSKCKRHFASPSALLNHLESGRCCSGLSRQGIYRLIQTHDTERLITSGPKVQNLIDKRSAWSDSSSSSSGTPILTPTSSASSSPILMGTQAPDRGTLPQLETLSMTNENASRHLSMPNLRSVSSGALSKCLACPTHTDICGTVNTMRSQFTSPIHPQKPFHCPIDISQSPSKGTNTPMKYFRTLGGLAQHVESGACGGGAETLKMAIALVQGKLEAMGFGALRLLK